jgi:bacterioferritin-associated ferredoxin
LAITSLGRYSRTRQVRAALPHLLGAAVYACICHAVSETDVELAVAGGADSIEAIGEATCAGTGCGSCHVVLEGLLDRVCGPVFVLETG